MKYKPELRDEIAKVVVESNRSIAEVAREYGLNETTVGWLGEEVPGCTCGRGATAGIVPIAVRNTPRPNTARNSVISSYDIRSGGPVNVGIMRSRNRFSRP